MMMINLCSRVEKQGNERTLFLVFLLGLTQMVLKCIKKYDVDGANCLLISKIIVLYIFIFGNCQECYILLGAYCKY